MRVQSAIFAMRLMKSAKSNWATKADTTSNDGFRREVDANASGKVEELSWVGLMRIFRV
jgi:hypothetical protein